MIFVKSGTPGSLEMVQEMVTQLESEGYAVVEQYNQVDVLYTGLLRTK